MGGHAPLDVLTILGGSWNAFLNKSFLTDMGFLASETIRIIGVLGISDSIVRTRLPLRCRSKVLYGRSIIIVCGARGAGKSSLLSALMFEFPLSQRILTIEDTREIATE